MGSQHHASPAVLPVVTAGHRCLAFPGSTHGWNDTSSLGISSRGVERPRAHGRVERSWIEVCLDFNKMYIDITAIPVQFQ